jgi:uncharacterized protein (DUF1330 family)
MPVYIIIEARVKNQGKYDEYVAAFSEIIASYGGRYLVQGARVTPIDEGMRPERRQPERMSVIEFQSEVQRRRFFASPEYKKIMPLRQAAADSRAFLLEGFTPEKS